MQKRVLRAEPKSKRGAIRAIAGPKEEIVFGLGESSLGHVLVACSAEGVVSILVGEAPHRLVDDLEENFPNARVVHEDRDCADLVAQVVDYIEKPRRTFDVTLDMRGTPFQQLVWKAVQKVPAGVTSNYSEIARAIGKPKAMRAVGTACANSRFALAVPCHRVLHKDGSPSGGSFWFGEHQRELLDREAKIRDPPKAIARQENSLMSSDHSDHVVRTPEQLAALYGTVSEASLKKEISFIHPLYRSLIEASPFAVLATNGPAGLDVSPRGDTPGFITVQDERTLLLPDRRGNDRIDSLRNLLTDPRMALLFLIPGVGETLRVNGRATISVDPELLGRFAVDGQLPKCVLVVEVEAAFFQCARAIQRSKLWESADPEVRAKVPTAGAILAALTGGGIDGEKYDRELPARQKSTLY